MAVPIALVVVVYARVLRGEFQFDDYHSIVQNPAIKDVGAQLRGFFAAMLHGARPVADLTFALNYAVSRLDPWSYHAANLGIHVAAVVLVYGFTRTVLRLAGAARPGGTSLFVAAAFALHPLQTEAVSYVVQRSESLASALYVAALLLILRAERPGPAAGRAAAYAGALAAFLLGFGTKAIVVTMPAAYVLLVATVPGEHARKEMAPWRVRVALLAPWLLAAACGIWIVLRGLEGAPDAGFAISGLSPKSYFLTQLLVVPTYLRLLFWPAGQNGDWAFLFRRDLDPEVLAGGALLVTLVILASVAALVVGRRWSGASGAAARVGGFGVLWFFLLLAPTSSVVPLADALAERRVYLASWGIFVAVAVAGERLIARWAGSRARTVAVTATVAVAALLAVLTFQRNAVWETSIAFWADAASKAPHNTRARRMLGTAYFERGDYEQAIREYGAALAPDPTGQQMSREEEAFTLANLGSALNLAGKTDDAISALRRSIELDPRNGPALARLANMLMRTGDLANAERYARRAAEVDPRDGFALSLVAYLRALAKDPSGAQAYVARAIATDPDDSATAIYVGMVYAELGRPAEACVSWHRALQLKLNSGLRDTIEKQVAASCR